MELVPSQYTATGDRWKYRFTRVDLNGNPMWSALRWPVDMPYIPPIAELLVQPRSLSPSELVWSPLLTSSHPTRLLNFGDLEILVGSQLIC